MKGTNYPYLSIAFAYTDFSDGVSGNIMRLGLGNVHMPTKTVGLLVESPYDAENRDPVSRSRLNIVGGIACFIY